MDGPRVGTSTLEHGWIRHGRARLNLAMRLASRSHSLLSAGGAARGPGRRAVAVAGIVVDVALARRLARSDRSEVALQAAVDAVDLAVWTALSTEPGPGQLSTAMNSGHPLAVEAGARHGWRGLAVPVAGIVGTGLIDRARNRPSAPEAFVWQVAAVLGGAGLARYVGRLRARRLAAHEIELVATLDRAELEAQNDLALGLDNLVDEVQRAAVLVQLAAAVPPGPAGPWKAELAARTRRSHRYLVDVLGTWQRRHNQTSELAEVVQLVLGEELAPTILDAVAAAAVESGLDELGLRGRVPVTLVPPAAGAVGRDVTIRVGATELTVDTGVEAVRLEVDPLPGGFAWLALWLAAAGPQDDVPAAAWALPAGAALGLTAWADRAGRGPSPAPAAPAVLASTALTLAAGVVQTASARRPRERPELPPVPVSLGLRGHAFVTALAAPRLTRPVLVTACAGGAATLVASWWLTPHPRPVREFLAELSWVAMSATMARAFTEGIARDSADLEAAVAADDARRLRRSALEGRAAAVERVAAALAEAERLTREHRAALAPDVAAEADRRLVACRVRLARVGGEPDPVGHSGVRGDPTG